MTIESEDQLDKLRNVGGLVARTLAAMGKALEPGMTTKELDDLVATRRGPVILTLA